MHTLRVASAPDSGCVVALPPLAIQKGEVDPAPTVRHTHTIEASELQQPGSDTHIHARGLKGVARRFVGVPRVAPSICKALGEAEGVGGVQQVALEDHLQYVRMCVRGREPSNTEIHA